jgi:predicted metal-dependent hydrolase
MKIEELPDEVLVLDRTPFYDLEELTAEVVREMFTDYGRVPPIRWTLRPMEVYFGQYSKGVDQDQIKINSLLNSVDVPRETVKYVIYHELLHRDNMTHDRAFRLLEHQYPNWTQHERFLDYTFPKFDVKYAM